MRTETTVLIDAMRILAQDIQSEDGVANAAIAEAADRLEELNAELEQALKAKDAAEQERDQLKANLHAVRNAARKLSFGLVEDEATGEESEFTRQWFGKLQDAIASTPEQSLSAHDAEVERLRKCRDAEQEYEKLMMRLVGEDGLGSVEHAIRAINRERDQLAVEVEALKPYRDNHHDLIRHMAAHDAEVIERFCAWLMENSHLDKTTYEGAVEYINQLRQQAKEARS